MPGEQRPFTIDARGVELSGEHAGEGVPVVLLHGLTATRRYVVMGSRSLERSRHLVVSYDARGHGRSAAAREPDALDALPLKVRQVAYNYNHLMEQPTLFYALVFYTHLTRPWMADVPLILAWIYVLLRIVHSLVQATVNVVMLRFALHVAGTLALMGLAAWDLWKML